MIIVFILLRLMKYLAERAKGFIVLRVQVDRRIDVEKTLEWAARKNPEVRSHCSSSCGTFKLSRLVSLPGIQ